MFYFMSPIPIVIARRVAGDVDSTSTACKELALFFTTGIVVSAFGLPIVLANVGAVSDVPDERIVVLLLLLMRDTVAHAVVMHITSKV